MSYSLRRYGLPKVRGSYKRGFKMRNISWMGTGGMVDVLYQPKDVEDLIYFLQKNNLAIYTVGSCSNVIVRDTAIRGAVVKLGREFADMQCDGSTITVGCAATLREVSLFARDNGISGFEFCIGIPGTIGGAIATNASAYEGNIRSLLHSVRAVNHSGEFCTLYPEDLVDLYYGGEGVQGECIFVDATFKGIPKGADSIKDTMKDIILRRSVSQPMQGRVMGYIFQNPVGEEEARVLIEEAGCKGMQMGKAAISEKHCNFFEDRGGVTSGELEALGNEVKHAVKHKVGKTLEWNLRFMGEGV